MNEYRRRYPERRIPSKRVFTRVEQSLRDNGCLPSFVLHSEREVVRTINARENILDVVQRSPRLSTRRMASRVGLSRMKVWRTLHEENLLAVYSGWKLFDNYDTYASVFVVLFNGFISFTSYFDVMCRFNITETTYSCQFQYVFGNQ